MKTRMSKSEAQLRSRFDFSRATRGRFSERYWQGHTITLLDGDPELTDDPFDLSSATSTREAGKQVFEEQIKAAGLGLEKPPRPEDFDYLLYPRATRNGGGAACRVELHTSANEGFGLWKKSLRTPRSIIAYVWRAQSRDEASIYALTYAEAYQIISDKGYINTYSWQELGGYSVSNAGAALKEMLARFRMTPERWEEKLRSI